MCMSSLCIRATCVIISKWEMIVYFPQEECERPGACCACLENLLYLWLMHKAPPSPHFPLFASLMSRVTSQHDNTVVTLGRLKDLGEGLQGCQPLGDVTRLTPSAKATAGACTPGTTCSGLLIPLYPPLLVIYSLSLSHAHT